MSRRMNLEEGTRHIHYATISLVVLCDYFDMGNCEWEKNRGGNKRWGVWKSVCVGVDGGNTGIHSTIHFQDPSLISSPAISITSPYRYGVSDCTSTSNYFLNKSLENQNSLPSPLQHVFFKLYTIQQLI